MQIVTGVNIYNKILEESVVTIGNFDGVHRGHAEIFAHLKRKSMELGLPSVAVTFEPHPLKVLAPGSAPSLITTFEQKAALIAESGIDYLIVVPFSKEFSLLPASDFVLKILCTPLGMRHIIIGHDYAFGRNREGNFTTLQQLGALHRFSLEDLPPIGEEGVVFSSSLVRSAITEGDMDSATRILGRYFQISGTVVHGREIGAKIGFPTANIATENELIPPDGVYAVMVSIGDQLIKGACSVGKNPTFEGSKHTIEVFLLDYSGQLYDRRLELCFVRRLRDMKKFSDSSGLVSSITNDVLQTREILATVDMDKVKPVAKMGTNEIEI